jgi:hypothetical protein
MVFVIWKLSAAVGRVEKANLYSCYLSSNATRHLLTLGRGKAHNLKRITSISAMTVVEGKWKMVGKAMNRDKR